jgi:nucleotide-binding universal stress UspA family protein
MVTVPELVHDPLEVILVATDFSDTANLTLERALEIARGHGSEIILLHVMQAEMPTVVASEMIVVPPDYEGMLREASSQGLRSAGGRVRAAGVRVREVLEQGPPARTIAACADAIGVDLIMVGTRGHTGLKHLILGSVAEEVVRISTRPVLTVHPGDERPIEPVQKILFPTDFSPAADQALRAAIRLLVGSGKARVLLVHTFHIAPAVVPLGGFGSGLEPDFVESAQELADKATAPTAKALRDRGFDVEVLVVRGDPAQVVTELAREHDVDVIVMGTRGHSKIRQWFLGSTAERVVEHAPCPVMTVHE